MGLGKFPKKLRVGPRQNFIPSLIKDKKCKSVRRAGHIACKQGYEKAASLAFAGEEFDAGSIQISKDSL